MALTLSPFPVNPDARVDNMLVRFRASNLFKKKATRQDFGIELIAPEPGGFWPPVGSVMYKDALFIEKTDDSDVRILTTTNPDGGPDSDAAEVWIDGVKHGEARMPFTAVFRGIDVTQ